MFFSTVIVTMTMMVAHVVGAPQQQTMSSLYGFTWPTRSGAFPTHTTVQSAEISSATTYTIVKPALTTETLSRSGSTMVPTPTSTTLTSANSSSMSSGKSSSGFSLEIPTVTRPGTNSAGITAPFTITIFTSTPSTTRITTEAPVSHETAPYSSVLSKPKSTVTITVTSTELSGPKTVFTTLRTSSVVAPQISSAVVSSAVSVHSSSQFSSPSTTCTTHTAASTSLLPARTGFPSETRPLPTFTNLPITHKTVPPPTSTPILSSSVYRDTLLPSKSSLELVQSTVTDISSLPVTSTTLSTSYTGIPALPTSWPKPISQGPAKVPFPKNDAAIIAGSILGVIVVVCAAIWLWMCWGEPWLGFGCASRKNKNGDVEKGDGEDDVNGVSKKYRKGGFLPFFGFFKKGKTDNKDVEKGLDDVDSTNMIARSAYGLEGTADTPSNIQTQAPTNTARWSNVDSVMTWNAKDRAAMHWARLKGQLSSVCRKFETKSKGEDLDVEKAVNSGTYTPEDCVTGPEPSSSDHEEYMMSGARAVPPPVEDASLVDIPLTQNPLPVELEPALTKGYGLGLMDRYWRTTGKFLALGKFSRTNVDAM